MLRWLYRKLTQCTVVVRLPKLSSSSMGCSIHIVASATPTMANAGSGTPWLY